jgi:acyl phosphate:glycerol-3-phosphate acyltransferase
LTFAAIVVFGYLLGSCPWGYWLIRVFKGEDIRKVGSGNIGIANVVRSYSRWFAVPLVLLDVGKGFVPALLGVVYVSPLCGVLAGGAAMLGHWRPFFLRFARSGKMVATGGGAFLALAPLVALTGLGIWIVVFALFGFASVASVSTALFMPIGAWAYGSSRYVIGFALAALVSTVSLHRGNLNRLRHGTEHQWRMAVVPRLRLSRS